MNAPDGAPDFFNDPTMLAQADHAFLLHAPENIVKQFPQFPSFDDYAVLTRALLARI